MEYRAFVKDILTLKEEQTDLQIIPYNAERHKEILKLLYNKYNLKELEKNWIQKNEIYTKGIYFIKTNEEYVSYIIPNLNNGKIYIWDLKGKNSYMKPLIIKIAEDLNNLSYEKLFIKNIQKNELAKYKNIFFKKIDTLK